MDVSIHMLATGRSSESGVEKFGIKYDRQLTLRQAGILAVVLQ